MFIDKIYTMNIFRITIIQLLFITNIYAIDATIKIEKDVEQRAIIGLVNESNTDSSSVFNQFKQDFKISGHFLVKNSINGSSYDSNIIPLKLKSMEYIVKFKYSVDNLHKLSVKLIKVSNNKVLLQKNYNMNDSKKVPFIVHKSVSDINDILGFKSIDWINKFIIYSVYTSPKKSDIVLSDYSFNFQKTIISGGLNIFPKWLNKSKTSFLYTTYERGVPTLYKVNLKNGHKKKIITSQGMLVCSDVSKDSSKVLLTMAPNSQADIYELNLKTGVKKRLTTFKGIDVNGKYMNDEKSIAFVSNRLKYAKIFTKKIGKKGASKLIYHGKNNNSCDIYGDNVAYSSKETNSAFGKNRFNIYVASLSKSTTFPVTATGENQFPRFSQDGSILMYVKKQRNNSSVGYINLTSKQSILIPINNKKIQSIDW